MYSIYKIIYIQNLKVYVKQNIDPQHWYHQHTKKPPTIILKDVLKYKPFEQNFNLKLLHVGHN
jgi:hypothetical protein